MATQSARTARQKVHDIIRPFGVGSVDDFLYFLKWSSSVITGASALAFFTGEDITPHNLSLSVSQTGRSRVHVFCVRHGYEYLQTFHSDNEQSVWTEHSYYCNFESGRQITVTISRNHVPFLPVFNFSTTFGMNFITPQGAVCLYPEYLPRNQGVILYRRSDNEVIGELLHRHNFILQPSCDNTVRSFLEHPRGMSLDTILFIPLDNSYVGASPMQQYDIVWRLAGQSGSPNGAVIDLQSDQIRGFSKTFRRAITI
ncbi:hypothetical protein JR316_0004218 [Psilocybe cubensis]|uniref:Uncharacterized protein n=3 Tax=Psilocybe cubensis TaxID=181762 RepID=A0A8H7XSS1_PSICU|nr:hypothetical protein JR316_0010267 [Psilocybe cubensis]XP_047749748.1 hypothetical protein JR316_0004218 [Psilocybe cubensis]KAH9478031.1 hypothetical protein JR316_0010267 [Psilocybe cubensis]KAH9482123.1 hypothetical protein JR316_0004218 [Psilocybe cubensis]